MANFWVRPDATVTEVASGTFSVPGAGYITESASNPAVGTLTLTEISASTTASRVFEGAAGSAQVTLSGSHTGPTDTIEYRIEAPGGAAVTTWATLQADVVEGAFSAAVTVPRGGWYVAHVRKASSQSTEAIHLNKWGVGIILGTFGQSQLQGFEGTGTATPDARAVIHDGTAWQAMPSAGAGRNAFASALIALADCPVAVIAYAVGGTAIDYWWYLGAKSSSYNTWESRVTAAGGELSAFMLWQGEGDANIERSKAAYKADIDAVFAQLRTDYGSTLPVVIGQLGRYTGAGLPDTAFEAIRDAHVDASNDPNNFGFVTYDSTLTDNIHLDGATHAKLGPRIARCVAKAYGFSAYSRGPLPANASRNGSIIDVQISHDGGTDFTPSTGIAGFDVLDNGTPVTISSAVRLSADKVRLTLAATPTGTVTVRYGYGLNPNQAGLLKDNSALTLPLVTTDADLLAQGRKVLLDCIQRVGGAAASSITGLRWAFFDQSTPNALAAPAVTGTGESTDGAGVLEIDVIGTALNVGDTGYLVTDTAAGVGFCGPVVVSG
jgi:Carbohydrate esterase, sialic acid-specific acetylesterase